MAFDVTEVRENIQGKESVTISEHKGFKFIVGRNDCDKEAIGLMLTSDTAICDKLMSGLTSVSMLDVMHYLSLNQSVAKNVFKNDVETQFMIFPTIYQEEDVVGVVVRSTRMTIEQMNSKFIEIVKTITTVK